MSDTTNTRKYKGYELDQTTSHRRNQNRPWFWKVLGISLLLTVLILAGVVFGLLHRTHKNAKHVEEINSANTVEALLKDHKLVTITASYSHLAEGSDYTTTRQIKKDKKGNYFSYFKKEGSDDDYKEVISNKELYRYNGKYTQYFGLVGNDYEEECVKAIEHSIYQGDTKDQVQNEKERDSTITLQLTTKVQSGDDYDTVYGFSAGDTIEKTIIIDKKTQLITSVEEKCGDEVFYGYTVEFDGEEKIPQFYKDLKKEKEKRVCTVYSDYGGEKNQEYTFNIPIDLYFTVLDYDGYKVYEDKDGTKEFTHYQMEVQNPDSDLSLYIKAESSK